MFSMSKQDNQQALELLLSRVTDAMLTTDPSTEEYAELLGQLERLTKLKAKDKPQRVSRDTLAVIAANLVGILIIVAYEQKHVVTSKAFGNVLKPKTN